MVILNCHICKACLNYKLRWNKVNFALYELNCVLCKNIYLIRLNFVKSVKKKLSKEKIDLILETAYLHYKLNGKLDERLSGELKVQQPNLLCYSTYLIKTTKLDHMCQYLP